MTELIEKLLRHAQEDSAEPLFEPFAITAAGRTILDGMLGEYREEIKRVETLLDNGAIPHPNHDELVVVLEKYQEVVRDFEEVIAAPDKRYIEFVKIGETESYATFGHRYDTIFDTPEWETFNIDWSLWDLLGEPQVIKILK